MPRKVKSAENGAFYFFSLFFQIDRLILKKQFAFQIRKQFPFFSHSAVFQNIFSVIFNIDFPELLFFFDSQHSQSEPAVSCYLLLDFFPHADFIQTDFIDDAQWDLKKMTPVQYRNHLLRAGERSRSLIIMNSVY
mgnify:CR=1 FL=1